MGLSGGVQMRPDRPYAAGMRLDVSGAWAAEAPPRLCAVRLGCGGSATKWTVARESPRNHKMDPILPTGGKWPFGALEGPFWSLEGPPYFWGAIFDTKHRDLLQSPVNRYKTRSSQLDLTKKKSSWEISIRVLLRMLVSGKS